MKRRTGPPSPARRHESLDAGKRTSGPGDRDTTAPARGWLIEGLIPAGVVFTVADLDDPPPDEIIAAGFDVVLYLHDRGAIDELPVLLSVHWRPGLMPGLEPPAPFWIRRSAHGFEPVTEATAA